MKKITVALAVLFFIVPSVSFAAALTSQQSSSLIAVVQSSPGTPASAFVSLITAFSNITVNQATSLITVVQAAPGVPANAFVDLLTSFTVDTTATQPATPTIPPTNTSVAPTVNTLTTTCTDKPIFQFTPIVKDSSGAIVPQSSSVLQVPYHGVVWFFSGDVKSSCTGSNLPYGSGWTVATHIDQGPFQEGNNVYSFGETNNSGSNVVTTDTIVISAMGQSVTTTIVLMPPQTQTSTSVACNDTPQITTTVFEPNPTVALDRVIMGNLSRQVEQLDGCGYSCFGGDENAVDANNYNGPNKDQVISLVRLYEKISSDSSTASNSQPWYTVLQQPVTITRLATTTDSMGSVQDVYSQIRFAVSAQSACGSTWSIAISNAQSPIHDNYGNAVGFSAITNSPPDNHIIDPSYPLSGGNEASSFFSSAQGYFSPSGQTNHQGAYIASIVASNGKTTATSTLTINVQ